MNQVLGRGEPRPWATNWPVSSLGAILIAAVVEIGIFTYCKRAKSFNGACNVETTLLANVNPYGTTTIYRSSEWLKPSYAG